MLRLKCSISSYIFFNLPIFIFGPMEHSDVIFTPGFGHFGHRFWKIGRVLYKNLKQSVGAIGKGNLPLSYDMWPTCIEKNTYSTCLLSWTKQFTRRIRVKIIGEEKYTDIHPTSDNTLHTLQVNNNMSLLPHVYPANHSTHIHTLYRNKNEDESSTIFYLSVNVHWGGPYIPSPLSSFSHPLLFLLLMTLEVV